MRPEDQVPTKGFEGGLPAYVVVQVEAGDGSFREQAKSASRLFSLGGLLAMLCLTGGDKDYWVIRGRASTDWYAGFIERLRGVPALAIADLENDWRTSFVLSGPKEGLSELGTLELDPWEDYAFGVCAQPLTQKQLKAALVETDQRIWMRLESVRLAAECVPLLWEGAFCAHCLYCDAPLDVGICPSGGKAMVRVFPGTAVVSEDDAMGHAEVGDMFG